MESQGGFAKADSVNAWDSTKFPKAWEFNYFYNKYSKAFNETIVSMNNTEVMDLLSFEKLFAMTRLP